MSLQFHVKQGTRAAHRSQRSSREEHFSSATRLPVPVRGHGFTDLLKEVQLLFVQGNPQKQGIALCLTP